MSSTILTYTLALAALYSSAQAHMQMSVPKPFPGGSNPLNTSPLNNPPMTNSPNIYPCQTSDYSFTFERTQMVPGSTQNLTLYSAEPDPAVHGGGSCQVSLTADLEPTARSKFNVIHSIVGGCPMRHMSGNADDVPTPNGGQLSYDFTIPEGTPAGQYTLAWSWFNRIGNREMYMNCAPIEVTDASTGDHRIKSRRHNHARGAHLVRRDTSPLDSLPKMYIANIPGIPSTCSTEDVDNMDLIFPSPGPGALTVAPIATDVATSWAQKLPATACYAPIGGAQQDAITQPAAAPTYAVSSAAAVVPTSAVFSAAASASYASPASSAASAAYAPYSAAPAMPVHTAGATNSGSCYASETPCNQDGGLICIGDKQFGICNRGCAIAQDLAAGTTCQGGVIAKRDTETMVAPLVLAARVHRAKHMREKRWGS